VGHAYGCVGGASLVFLGSNSPSGVASVDMTSLLSSSYDEYVLELFNVIPSVSTGPFLILQFSTNSGSTWDTTVANYMTGILYSRIDSNSSSGFSSAINSGLVVSGGVFNGQGISGRLIIRNPSASFWRQVESHVGLQATASEYYCEVGTGYWKSNTAFNGMKMLFPSANIAGGLIRLYGISH
jgi:hypothetical protein